MRFFVLLLLLAALASQTASAQLRLYSVDAAGADARRQVFLTWVPVGRAI